MASFDYQYIESLVTRVQEGDSNAFAELYASTYQKQYRFAYNYLKEEFLAHDALQETYILVLKNIGTLKDAKLFVAWLNQIMFRVCFKLHDKQKRYYEELNEYDNNSSAYRDKKESSPESYAIKIDEHDYIIRQVMNLPFTEAQAILLRYYHDMKIDEIAKLMEISRSSVKRAIKNGQTRLKDLLQR
ncbi:MAG: RNA polymerase sigma factor [Clostridiales bacterium]|nr:RNA polymerase sigma factor [Clostridiales bacterium]